LKKRSCCLVILALALLSAAAPGYTQSETRVTFTTPFTFVAGAAQLPPGSYTISQDDGGHALIFPARGGKSAAILLTRASGLTAGKGQASVTFTEREGRYYLDRVNLTSGTVVTIGR
jgi:hypothetical protein